MDREEIIRLKLEIYQNIYDAMIFNNPVYINTKMRELEAQLELLEEMKG